MPALCESRGSVLGSPRKMGVEVRRWGTMDSARKGASRRDLLSQVTLGEVRAGIARRIGGPEKLRVGFTWAMGLLCSPPVPPTSNGAGSGRLPRSQPGHAQRACAAGMRSGRPQVGSPAPAHPDSRVGSCSVARVECPQSEVV